MKTYMEDNREDNELPCNGTNMMYSAHQRRIILILMGSIGSVSMTMCLAALLCVLCTRFYKMFAYRMALYQVLSSTFVSFAVTFAVIQLDNTAPVVAIKITCEAGGFFLEYFVWVKLLLSLSLIFHLFCLTVFMKNFKRLEIVYFLFSFLLPLLISWIPFVKSLYGLTEAWCWIKERMDTGDCTIEPYNQGIIEQYVLWYGPLSVGITVGFVAIVIILITFVKRYRKLSCPEKDPLLEGFMKGYMLQVYFRKLIPLLVYPVVFFILSVPSLVNQFYHLVSSKPLYSLLIVQVVCFSMNGLFSSLVLISHVILVRHLKSWGEYFFEKNNIETFDPTSSLNGTGRRSRGSHGVSESAD